MKIAVASSGLGTVQRGIEAWARSLAEGLHRAGQDVILLHGGGEYACPNRRIRFLKRGGMTARLCAKFAPAFLWRANLKDAYGVEQVSFARAVGRALKGAAPHIVHTQDVVLARRLEHCRARGRWNSPVILAHGTDEDMRALAGVRYVQHLAPAHEAKARAALGESVVHFCVPNFVDVHQFCPAQESRQAMRRKLGIPPESFVIGCAAALKRTHKRVDALIGEVASLLAPPRGGAGLGDIRLMVAGAVTDETPQVTRLAGERLGDRCLLLKDLPFSEMPAFYRCLDLYVHPAIEEFFGICILEAMSSGVPVVVHDSETLRWIVGAGGWCVDMRREGFLLALAEELARARPDKASRTRDEVQRRFSWEAVFPRLAAMYAAVENDWQRQVPAFSASARKAATSRAKDGSRAAISEKRRLPALRRTGWMWSRGNDAPPRRRQSVPEPS